MPRNFGLTSRPGAGAVDRPAGSIAPGGWRNSNSVVPVQGSSRSPVHYGAPMRRILSWPVLGQSHDAADDHPNPQHDEEHLDRQRRPADAWQLHLHPLLLGLSIALGVWLVWLRFFDLFEFE